MADVIGARMTSNVGDLRPRKVGSVTDEESPSSAERAREILDAMEEPEPAPPEPSEEPAEREHRERVGRLRNLAEARGLTLTHDGGWVLQRKVHGIRDSDAIPITPKKIDSDYGAGLTLDQIESYLTETEAPTLREAMRLREALSLLKLYDTPELDEAAQLEGELPYRPDSYLREPRPYADEAKTLAELRARGFPV